ncbi:MAG TPA: glutaredoxin family protein [Gaiellaceae bacterium]
MPRCASPHTAWPSSASPKRPPRAAFIRKVVLYHATGCHLCERARTVVAEIRQEIPFELEEIEIDGDPGLEARYREWLPVLEIDGERAFVYYVDPDAFRRKVTAQS